MDQTHEAFRHQCRSKFRRIVWIPYVTISFGEPDACDSLCSLWYDGRGTPTLNHNGWKKQNKFIVREIVYPKVKPGEIAWLSWYPMRSDYSWINWKMSIPTLANWKTSKSHVPPHIQATFFSSFTKNTIYLWKFSITEKIHFSLK